MVLRRAAEHRLYGEPRSGQGLAAASDDGPADTPISGCGRAASFRHDLAPSETPQPGWVEMRTVAGPLRLVQWISTANNTRLGRLAVGIYGGAPRRGRL